MISVDIYAIRRNVDHCADTPQFVCFCNKQTNLVKDRRPTPVTCSEYDKWLCTFTQDGVRGWGWEGPPPSTSFLQVGICRQKGYGFWIVLVYNLKTAMDFRSQVWKRRLILQVTFENRYGFYSIFSPEMESEMGESGVTTPPKLLRSIPPPQTIRKDRLIDASCLFLNSAVSWCHTCCVILKKESSNNLYMHGEEEATRPYNVTDMSGSGSGYWK